MKRLLALACFALLCGSAVAAGEREPVRKPHRPTTKGRRCRMGRTPAEIAEGAEWYWEGGDKDTYELLSATALVC